MGISVVTTSEWNLIYASWLVRWKSRVRAHPVLASEAKVLSTDFCLPFETPFFFVLGMIRL